ncbi:MAG: type II secretion system protein [Oscillospiraceae bacterium]|nr:type II secretion system protein [Oscillospiraceae bacterium]
MKGNNAGFSLVEIVAAIAILGIFFGTACTSLVLGLRMNEKTDAKLQAQLAVSSAVETLMAEGIDSAKVTTPDIDYGLTTETDENGIPFDRFPEVTVSVKTVPDEVGGASLPYFKVTVTSDKVEDVTVTTYIREAVNKP